MAANSKIQWTNHTFNCWRGCQRVAEGCRNCYAETLSLRFPGQMGEWGPQGKRVVASEGMWREPIKWNAWAKHGTCHHCGGAGSTVDRKKQSRSSCQGCGGSGKVKPYRARVFCASLADVFEDWRGPMVDASGRELWTREEGRFEPEPSPDQLNDAIEQNWRRAKMADVRRRLFGLIDATPNLDWLLLTKRPENILSMVPEYAYHYFRQNVWLGTSIACLKDAANIDRLRECRPICPVVFLSIEPLIEDVSSLDLTTGIDWVIVGGESGDGARPMHPDWVRAIRDQCVAAGVPFLFKQWGEWGPTTDSPITRTGGLCGAPRYREAINLDATGNIVSTNDLISISKPADWVMLWKNGKKMSGRLLDGQEWNGYPEPTTSSR